MTIRPGEEWGESIERPDDLVVAADDAELARLVRSAGPEADVSVSGGDVHRALGAPGPRPVAQRLPMDTIDVCLDGRTSFLAVAHVVARRSWWRGPLVAVMNVGSIGTWNVAPRAHPNDGRLDAVEADAAMPARERWMAHRRLPHGTHVPHPSIRTARVESHEWRFDRPMRVWADGVAVGRTRSLRVAVTPDAYRLVV